MIWWLVDNVNVIYFILGLALLGVGVLFWQTKRGRELLAMAFIIAVGFLVWFLCSLVMTDRKQIESNMRALAEAALHGKPDEVTPLLSKDFRFRGMTKADVGAWVTQNARDGGVTSYNLSDFNVEKLSHDIDQSRAEAVFRLRVDHRNGTSMFLCPVVFLKEEGQWRLQSIKLNNPVSGEPLFE